MCRFNLRFAIPAGILLGFGVRGDRGDSAPTPKVAPTFPKATATTPKAAAPPPKAAAPTHITVSKPKGTGVTGMRCVVLNRVMHRG